MNLQASRSFPFFPYLTLCAVSMSLGWGLRGTIGGGPVGAMIPGVMIGLPIALAFNLRKDLGALLAFTTVGVALGGQMTYGQTIGFTKTGPLWWGLWGMTLKGAVWGLTGGVVVGLGFMRRKYRMEELLWGLLILMAMTICGRELLDAPKIYYLSNRWVDPREEVWMGLLLGGVSLQFYLLLLNREKVTLNFAFWGMICGAIGFGGGGLFFPLEDFIKEAISEKSPVWFLRGFPAWKGMEFFFGLMLGIGYGLAAYLKRHEILAEEERSEATFDTWDRLPGFLRYVLAIAIPPLALWLHFTVQFHPMYTITGTILLLAALGSPRAAFHVAVTMTIVAFLRDHAYAMAEQFHYEIGPGAWLMVFLLTIPVAIVIEALPKRSSYFTLIALMLVGWLGTLTALDKLGIQENLTPSFTVLVFVNEAVVMTMLALAFQRWNRKRGVPGNSPAKSVA